MTSATAAGQVPAMKASTSTEVVLDWGTQFPDTAYAVSVSLSTTLKGKVTYTRVNAVSYTTVTFTALVDVAGGPISALAYAF